MVPKFDGRSEDKLSYGIWESRYIPITIKLSFFCYCSGSEFFVVTIGGFSVAESYSGSDLDVVGREGIEGSVSTIGKSDFEDGDHYGNNVRGENGMN